VKLVVTDVPGLDGEYPADITFFTNRELHKIKKMTGLRAGEFMEAFQAGDNDMVVALAVVVMEREGKEGAEDLLWDAPAGSVTLEDDEDEVVVEDDALPPAQPTETASEPEPSDSDRSESSGDSSRPVSVLPVSDQSLTGLPRSGTSAG
jgi:hypothetical protein